MLPSHLNLRTHLSVAIRSLAIELKSSVLFAADTLLKGVLVALPSTEPVGVDVEGEADVPFCFAACFAAFSANLFCLDAEGGIFGS